MHCDEGLKIAHYLPWHATISPKSLKCSITHMYYAISQVQNTHRLCLQTKRITVRIKGKRVWCLNESANPKTPQAGDIKGHLNGLLEWDRAVHTCLSPSLVNYWAGTHFATFSSSLWIIDAWCGTMAPHLVRDAPRLKPGLKCSPAPFNGRCARKRGDPNDTHTHTQLLVEEHSEWVTDKRM